MKYCQKDYSYFMFVELQQKYDRIKDAVDLGLTECSSKELYEMKIAVYFPTDDKDMKAVDEINFTLKAAFRSNFLISQ